MPEGPEVETIRRSLEPLLVGRTFGRAWTSRKKLRLTAPKKAWDALEGARVTGLGRRGKLMWIDTDTGRGLLVRLGMTGKLHVTQPDDALAPHTHVRLALDHGELRYVDARRFGSVVPFAGTDKDDETARMGPDALALDAAGRAWISGRVHATERTLKDVLMDQGVFAGVGNIYASEAMFLARLSPFRSGSSLTAGEIARLQDAVSEVLTQAVGRRGTSFSDYVDGLGVPGDNLDHLLVFQREGEPCRTCGRPVEREAQGQRSTFFCRTCQQVAKRRRRLG